MPLDPVLPGVLTSGLGIGSTGAGSAPGGAKDSPERIRDAASQFEALLISQVLKASHQGEDEGWLGTGEDQTADSVMGLAEDYFARSIAARGGFGLSRMVAAQLEHRVSAWQVTDLPNGAATPSDTTDTDPKVANH